MAGIYRHFIKILRVIVEPLNQLTRKHAKFEWKTECEAGFRTILHLLVQKQILCYPNFNETFYLATDASIPTCNAVSCINV